MCARRVYTFCLYATRHSFHNKSPYYFYSFFYSMCERRVHFTYQVRHTTAPSIISCKKEEKREGYNKNHVGSKRKQKQKKEDTKKKEEDHVPKPSAAPQSCCGGTSSIYIGMHVFHFLVGLWYLAIYPVSHLLPTFVHRRFPLLLLLQFFAPPPPIHYLVGITHDDGGGGCAVVCLIFVPPRHEPLCCFEDPPLPFPPRLFCCMQWTTARSELQTPRGQVPLTRRWIGTPQL